MFIFYFLKVCVAHNKYVVTIFLKKYTFMKKQGYF